MPAVCSSIRMSPDQQYILATGTYKPRVKCFEVCNLSIKFERCFDSEVTTFEVLSDDYSKMVFLQCDRFLEIHAAHGRHYRLRIPRFGRDMKYHKPSCDLCIVGTSSDVYRLNLERGQFLQPYETDSCCLNACEINPEHHLLMVGTKEGTVQAWDPRSKTRCATLDVAVKLPAAKAFPSVTALKCKNALGMGVGTASGHVLLYDLRSHEPLQIKDQLNKLPIQRIDFNNTQQAVYSMDSAMLKIWHESNGKQIAYIESNTRFNDFCTIPNSGIFFLAQEDVKMLTYYVPAMGPAPRWCSFLDNLTEEIESEVVENMYDDYQFVTQKELEELGLEHLIGTNLLKGYMHGYFLDVRLYNKAKAVIEPFAFDRFRKEKIRKEIESTRQPRLQLNQHLPKVNQELALKLIEEKANPSRAAKTKKLPSLLEDNRFKAMFENSDFTINRNAEEYKMLAPVLNRLEKSKAKELKKRVEVARVAELHADEEKSHEASDDDEDLFGFNNNNEDDEKSEESSDEENVREFAKEMKNAYKDVKKQRAAEDDAALLAIRNKVAEGKNTTLTANHNDSNTESQKPPKLKYVSYCGNFEIGGMSNAEMIAASKVSLQNRVQMDEKHNGKIEPVGNSLGNRQMTFDITKRLTRDMKKREYEMKKHREERKRVIRPIKSLKLKKVNFK